MIKKRVVISIFLLILVTLGGSSYYLLYGKKLGPQYVKPLEKVKIGNIGEYSILQLIAKEQGYFAENGLDAEVVEYTAGPPAIKDLLSGRIDIAIAAEFVGARTIFDNKDLQILASVDKHEDFQMAVRKDAVTFPADLKGKKIGVMLKGAGEFFLGRFLSFNGISTNDVTIMDLTPEEMTKKLESGEIDACVIFNTHIYKIKQAMGDAVEVWPVQRTRKIFATAYSTSGFIDRNTGIVRRYVRSLLAAETYLGKHPEESKIILKKAMGYDDDYIRYIWPNFEFTVRLDQEFLLALEDDARFIVYNKLTSETTVPNYLDHIYFAALVEAKPEAVSIIH